SAEKKPFIRVHRAAPGRGPNIIVGPRCEAPSPPLGDAAPVPGGMGTWKAVHGPRPLPAPGSRGHDAALSRGGLIGEDGFGRAVAIEVNEDQGPLPPFAPDHGWLAAGLSWRLEGQDLSHVVFDEDRWLPSPGADRDPAVGLGPADSLRDGPGRHGFK